MKGKLDKFIIMAEDFNSPLSTIDRAGQKIDQDIKKFNSTINQEELIDIYRTLHTTKAEYTFVQVPTNIY